MLSNARRLAVLVSLSLLAVLLVSAPGVAGVTDLFSISVTSPSLIFERGQGSVAIGSSAASVSWRIADETGTTVRTGTSWMSGGAAAIGVTDLPPGYFTLSIHAGAATPTDLTTSFAVIEPVPDTMVSAAAPFGAAVHIGRTGWPLSVLDEARKAGISHIREDAYWNKFEIQPGVYTFPAAYTAEIDRAKAAGLTPMLIANGANSLYDSGRTPSSPEGIAAFGNFAAALLDHYGLTNVEVLNEYNASTFNNSACGRTAACYLEVLTGVNQRVKAAVPAATVVGPATIGIGNCIQPDGTKCFAPDLIDRGGLNQLDAYSVHPYHYPGGPEWMAGSGDAIAGLRARIQAAGKNTPIVLSEMGWPTDTGHGTTELQQADNLIRLYAVALANGVTRIYWYDLVNDGTDPANAEHNFGMLRQPMIATAEQPVSVAANAPKPALVAQAVAARLIGTKLYQGSDGLTTPARSARFGTGSATVRVLWATSAATVTVSATGPLTAVDSYGRSSTLTPQGGTLSLSLTGSPVFLSGPVTGVTNG